MGIDDIFSGTETIEEDHRVSKRQLIQQAITLAVQSRWQEAAEVNQKIVAQVSDDAEAYNRLGKAYTELGRVADARVAYASALQADAANLIAQRNLDRLSRISDSEAGELAKKAGMKLDPRFFMEETGKTALLVLQDPEREEVLATLTAGDQVRLEGQDARLNVTTMDGQYIGRIDDRLSVRLTSLMKSGNEYQAGIVGVDGTTVRVMIREVRQAPANAGRISFPPQATHEPLPRPYLREGLLRREGDDEDEDDLDIDSDVDADDDDEEDPSELGFHEGTLDEA